jgi:phosphoglucosamine mutase
MVTEELCDQKATLSELAEPVTLYPQTTKNIKVQSKEAVTSDPEVLAELQEVEKLIGGNGRALLRESGTEPVIRVMVESEENCEELAERIANKIVLRGHKA